MKLAVVFLCLGITCLVDANVGGPNLRKLTVEDAHDAATQLYDICAQADEIKTGSVSEIKAKQLCLIQEVVSYLTTISVRLGCTLGDILGLMGVSPDAARLIQAKKYEELLETVDVGTLVKSTVCLVEGILANAGYLMQSLIVQIKILLGSGSSLPSSLYALHGTIEGVQASLRGTPIGAALDSISKALGGVLSGATGSLY